MGPDLLDHFRGAVLAHGKVEPVLDGRQPHLGEVARLCLEVRRVPDVLERLAAPQGQRLGERRLGGGEVFGRCLLVSPRSECGEAGGVRRELVVRPSSLRSRSSAAAGSGGGVGQTRATSASVVGGGSSRASAESASIAANARARLPGCTPPPAPETTTGPSTRTSMAEA